MTSLWGRRNRPDPIQRHVDMALATIAPVTPTAPAAPMMLAANDQLRADLLAARAQLRTTTATLALRDEQAAYHRGLVQGLQADNGFLRAQLDSARAELAAARRTQTARAAVATPSVLCSGCGVTLQHGISHYCVTVQDNAGTKEIAA